MNIVGCDLSLTATGIFGESRSMIVKPVTKGIARCAEIGHTLLVNFGYDADLIVLEGYSFGSRNSQAHALGELGGIVRFLLCQANVRYVEVPPTCLKKFATGKGNAGKDDMVATAARLGCPANDNNVVDAWWLRRMGLYAYDAADLPITGYRDEAVGKISWPAL